MQYHLATYELTRSYTYYVSKKEMTKDEAIETGLCEGFYPTLKRGWNLKSKGIPELSHDGEYGIHIIRKTTWEIKLPIFSGNPEKAIEIARKEAETFCGYNVWGPEANWNPDYESSHARLIKIIEGESGKNLRQTMRLTWKEMTMPDMQWSYSPYTIDKMFEALRHLAQTMQKYEKNRGKQIANLLSYSNKDGYSVNHSSNGNIRPVESLGDLKVRFIYALLGSSQDFYQEWRDDNDINLESGIQVKAPYRTDGYYNPETGVGTKSGRHETVSSMFHHIIDRARGMKLRVQLNSVHKSAVNIRKFKIAVIPEGFVFHLDYGFDGSTWHEEITRSRPGEPFHDTLYRAYNIIRTELIPDFETQSSEIETKKREDLFSL